MSRLTILAACLLLASCHGQSSSEVPGDAEDTQPYSGIADDDVIHVTGTEPFWGGDITGDAQGWAMDWITPDNIDGDRITLQRFAGRGGLSFSGTYEAKQFDLVLTPAQCSDGMSDRLYPFVATLQWGEEKREGCGWTENEPYSGGE